MFMRKLDELCMFLVSSRRALPHFGRYSFPSS